MDSCWRDRAKRCVNKSVFSCSSCWPSIVEKARFGGKIWFSIHAVIPILLDLLIILLSIQCRFAVIHYYRRFMWKEASKAF